MDALVAQSVFLRSGVRVIRTDRESLSIPRVTADGAANWTAEGTAITASDPSGDNVVATPRALKALTTLNNETLADSDPSVLDVVGLSLARACALKYDLGAFEGSGTAPEIRGLKNTSGIQNQSMGATGATPTNLDFVADAIGALDAANAQASVIVMHPRSWKTLVKIRTQTSGSNEPLLLADSNPTNEIRRSLYGVPVLLSSQLSITDTQGTSTNASSLYCYDASQVLAVLRKDASVEVDGSALFGSDQSQVRVVLRADMVVANPAAVVRVAGLLP